MNDKRVIVAMALRAYIESDTDHVDVALPGEAEGKGQR